MAYKGYSRALNVPRAPAGPKPSRDLVGGDFSVMVLATSVTEKKSSCGTVREHHQH
jgi:hypothetical protein